MRELRCTDNSDTHFCVPFCSFISSDFSSPTPVTSARRRALGEYVHDRDLSRHLSRAYRTCSRFSVEAKKPLCVLAQPFVAPVGRLDCAAADRLWRCSIHPAEVHPRLYGRSSNL